MKHRGVAISSCGGRILLLVFAGAAMCVPVRAGDNHSGRSLYIAQCGYCHGVDGRPDDNGRVALSPKPRDLTRGIFQLRSTLPGRPPTDTDLLTTITRGIPGSAMPGFAFLSKRDREAIIRHVKTLSPVFTSNADPKQAMVSLDRDPAKRGEARESIVTAGRAAYEKFSCGTCHGPEGRADGPASKSLKDSAGFPIHVRDFSSELFKGGSTTSEIYLRITTGMEGTPMPAWSQVSSAERWQLAYYIRSLCKAAGCNPAPPPPTSIASSRAAGEIPSDDPFSAAWQSAQAFRVPLFSLGNRGIPSPDLGVRSLTDGRTIAFLLEWADSTRDASTVRVEDFRDSIAIQFFTGTEYPSLAMGSRDSEVTIWQWKADWQEQVDSGKRPGPLNAHPWMIEPGYPMPAAAALEAGNQIALTRRLSPVEEATAKGPGTVTPKPLEDQRVSAKGVWRDGYWYVVVSRRLGPGSGISLSNGLTKLAFAIWNGSEGNRSGEKATSTWYALARNRR